jgi:hypothetical protein
MRKMQDDSVGICMPWPLHLTLRSCRRTDLGIDTQLPHRRYCHDKTVQKVDQFGASINLYRDMYYRHPDLFGKQSVVDRYVDDIACTLGVSRSLLNVVGQLFSRSPDAS